MLTDPDDDLRIQHLQECKHLSGFVPLGFQQMQPGETLLWSPHLTGICDVLEAVYYGEIRRLLLLIGPRTTKSTVLQCFTAWAWTMNAGLRAIFTHQEERLLISQAHGFRQIVQSNWYQSLWPSVRAVEDLNSLAHCKTTWGGERAAFTIGAKGINGHGADIILGDDMVSQSDYRSPAKLEEVIEYYKTMRNRMNDPATSRIAIIGHPTCSDDLYAVLREQKNFTVMCLPQEYDENRPCKVMTDDGSRVVFEDKRKHGELLCPKRWTPEALAEQKLDARKYAALFNLSPIPGGGVMFEQEWFRYFDREHDDFGVEWFVLHRKGQPEKKVKVKDCKIFASCDPAGLEPEVNKKPCWTVCMVCARTPDRELLVLDIWRRQVTIADTQTGINAFLHLYRPHGVLCEPNGVGLALFQHLKSQGWPMIESKTDGPKEARAEAAQAHVQGGMVYFKKNAAWGPALEHELMNFSGKGSAADQVDCLAHAARHIVEPTVLRLTPSRYFPVSVGGYQPMRAG